MPTQRIATVTPISEQDAAGKVAAIYADIKKTKKIDFVPNFWRVLATNPDHLEMIWTRLKSLMHPEAVGRTSPLDVKTRELIALAVSATNGCAYCLNSHTAALRKLGVSPNVLGEVMAIVGLSIPRIRLQTATRWCRTYCRRTIRGAVARRRGFARRSDVGPPSLSQAVGEYPICSGGAGPCVRRRRRRPTRPGACPGAGTPPGRPRRAARGR